MRLGCFLFLALPAFSHNAFFEPNLGQSGGEVEYIARGRGQVAFLSKASAAFHVGDSVVRMRFVSARPLMAPEGLEPTGGITSYFLGNDPAKWRTGVPHYSKVRYRDIYPGIDLVYYFSDGRLEYDLIVGPGANPDRMELAFEGVETIRSSASGDLRLVTSSGEIVQRRPKVFQGGREIRGAYRVSTGNRARFVLAKYDRTKPLVIDPILEYSTYIGGTAFDVAEDIKVDKSGHAYVAGWSRAPVGPALDPFQQTAGVSMEALLLKLAPDGKRLIYYAYFGGEFDDFAEAVDIDESGNAYLGGNTRSTNFPVRQAFQSRYGGGFNDAFILKLSADGKTLIYSTHLGGTREEQVGGLSVDESGNVIVASNTWSSDFPVTPNALQSTLAGGADGFISKLSPAGDSLVFSTYLGGSSNDYLHSMKLDRTGAAVVAGCTLSSDFPVKDGYQMRRLAFNGCSAFAARLNVTAPQLVWATFLGGPGGGLFFDVDVDDTGVYLAGVANENFEMKNAVQSTYGGGSDIVAAKLSLDGKQLLYSTYLGGSAIDYQGRVAAGPDGSAYICGFTGSANFPTKNSLQPYVGARDGYRYDAVVARLTPSGSDFVYSTLLGGNGRDGCAAIAVDASGTAYITGVTDSPDLPLKNAFQSEYRGGTGDIYVAKIAPDAVPAPEPLFSLNPQVVAFNGVAGSAAPPPQTVRIDARTRTNFRVEAAGASWLQVASSAMSTPVSLTFSVDLRGLGSGLYRHSVRIVSLDMLGPASSLEVTLRVLAAPPVVGSVSPPVFAVGSDEAQVIISGSGFTNGAVVQLNGTDLVTRFVNESTLHAVLPKSLFVAEGAHAVRVVNPQSAPSNPITLSVGPRAPQIANNAIVSAASFRSGAVSPGEIITIFGTDLGPATLTGLSLDGNGRVSTELARTRVLFDGIPAPLIYTSEKQISAVVPYGIEGRSATQAQVEYQGRRSINLSVPVVTAAPAIFTSDASGRGQAAALNQDGMNNSTIPAVRGSTIVLYATGGGRTEPASQDGGVAVPPLPALILPVAVEIDGKQAVVDYAGPAPGMVNGAIQVNARIPADVWPGVLPVVLRVGQTTSQPGVTLSVQ